jgi:hypothetical protein
VLILVPSFYCILDILFKIGPRPEAEPSANPQSLFSESVATGPKLTS